MSDGTDPIHKADAAARAQAAALIGAARFAALAVIEPATGAPFVSRIAFGLGPDKTPMTLISDLSLHTKALRADPRASLLLGEPGPKGEPLTHPRLSLQVTASLLPQDGPARQGLRRAWLSRHPKAALYVDFADFNFALFTVLRGHLNAGFAKAYALGPNDLTVA